MDKLIVVLIIFFSFNAVAQPDSTVVLSYQDFINIVVSEHPFAKTADIKINEGEAALLYAKGAFDPKVYTVVGQKYFNGDQYYSKIDGGLKIPTWFGIELQGGYEQNKGTYLNPENNTPNSGLLYGGISVTAGQGLLIDKRRAELKKAHLFQQVSKLERQIILNDLVFTAGTTYWSWFKSYNTLLVFNEATRLAEERFDAVKSGANFGDRPAIDTLEARIQVLNRTLGLQQAEVDFKNASVLLSIYLWADGVVPLEIADGTIPESIENIEAIGTNPSFLLQIDSMINNHPALNQSRYAIDQLEIDQRLKRNQLLPVVNLKYNPITEYVGGESFGNFSANNYIWGLEFQMPILLRKERGSLSLTALKIKEDNLKLDNMQEVVRYKVISAWNYWNATKDQIDLYAETVENANNLLEGERRLFNLGESSLFMVNSREVGYINTQLKFIELLTKNRNAELATVYELGNLANN